MAQRDQHGKRSVLHAHLEADGFALGIVKFEHLGHEKAQEKAHQRQDEARCHQIEEHGELFYQGARSLRHGAHHYEGEADDGERGEYGLDPAYRPAKDRSQDCTRQNRYDHEINEVMKKCIRVEGSEAAGEPEYHDRLQERREHRVERRDRDREGEVAFTYHRERVRSASSWGRAYHDYTDRKGLSRIPGKTFTMARERIKATAGMMIHLITTAILTILGLAAMRFQSWKVMASPMVNIIVIRRYGPAGGTMLFSTVG